MLAGLCDERLGFLLGQGKARRVRTRQAARQGRAREHRGGTSGSAARRAGAAANVPGFSAAQLPERTSERMKSFRLGKTPS